MNIWIVNPFDQLPNETDMPLRYWTLCRMLAEQHHEVTWWSSDFSHLTKSKRSACPPADGFTIRLIETPPYAKNISFARLRNHKAFGLRFYHDAIEQLRSRSLPAPNRILVSLPPLGIAEQAFRIRDAVNRQTNGPGCKVILDIQDAWPEVFHQVLPNPLRKTLGSLLLRKLHYSALNAYCGSDKISAVGQSYLDLASTYISKSPHKNNQQEKPTHLCYLGADLDSFQLHPNSKIPAEEEQAEASKERRPLRAVYVGSMNTSYDLKTLIQIAAKWNQEKRLPWQIHLAGSGSQMKTLQAICQKYGLSPNRIAFHGYLGRSAVTQLLRQADVGLVPNRPNSFVACPNKACEYAAAGLPMISCLGGELGQLLRNWNAGSEYKEGDVESLNKAFDKYSGNRGFLSEQNQNARKMAEQLFNRDHSYKSLIKHITD